MVGQWSAMTVLSPTTVRIISHVLLIMQGKILRKWDAKKFCNKSAELHRLAAENAQLTMPATTRDLHVLALDEFAQKRRIYCQLEI